jgi:hypothetical protein
VTDGEYIYTVKISMELLQLKFILNEDFYGLSSASRDKYQDCTLK